MRSWISEFCAKCHNKYIIGDVIYEDNKVTARLICPGSRNHPAKDVYSYDGGATWDNYPIKELLCCDTFNPLIFSNQIFTQLGIELGSGTARLKQ
jgi:hypothetical protein